MVLHDQARKTVKDCKSASDGDGLSDSASASDMEMEDDDDLLPEFKIRKPPLINVDSLQTLRSHGLAVIDYQHGIELHTAWSFSDVEAKLKELFPKLFQWFDGQHDKYNPDPYDVENVTLPHFRLCNKVGKQVSIANGVTYPTGHDLFFNSRIARAGFRYHILVLSTMSSFLM
jgi:hypothetical protein